MHIHLSVSIDWLIREIESKRTIKAKDKLALAFLSEWEHKLMSPYIYLIMELWKMKERWWEVFTSSECNNVKDNWACWWHE